MRVVISSILVSPAASYRAAVRDRTKGEPSMPAGWKAIARSKAVWVLVVALGFCVEPVPPVPAYAGAEGRTATTAYETHVADRAAYQLDPSPFTEAVTIVSRITFPNEADLRNVDTIWLAGFSSEGAAPPCRPGLALPPRRVVPALDPGPRYKLGPFPVVAAPGLRHGRVGGIQAAHPRERQVPRGGPYVRDDDQLRSR